MRKFIISTVLCVVFLLSFSVMGDTGVASVQYWIDHDHLSAKLSSSTEFDIDCSNLSTGFHTLNYRVADINGNFGALEEHGFLKMPKNIAATKIEKLQYWWDNRHENTIEIPYSDDEFILTTDALPFGMHNLNYRVKDDAGSWSELHSHYFYKAEAQDSARIVSYAFWWNDLQEEKIVWKLEKPTAVFELEEDFFVPETARTNYAGHYTATLNIIFSDNRGRSVLFSSDVEYPDCDAPVTDIDADAYVASSSVNISWKESTNDKMGDYNVYYSKDGGPFILWLHDTTLTSATFKGERGSLYLFTVTGRDAYGNREKYDETKCVSVTFE